MGNTAVLLSSNEMMVCGAGKLGQLGKQMPQTEIDEEQEESKIKDLEEQKKPIDNEHFAEIPRFYGKGRVNVRSMGCGKFHFMIVSTKATGGRAFSWGFNKFGQLGLGRISKFEE